MSAQNLLAQSLRRLHVPGKPLILANVYDVPSARAVGQLESAKVLATASAAVAAAAGFEDDDMPLEINLAAVRGIAKVAATFNKPLTVDLQDGYGEKLEEAVAIIVKLGAVGINLEDCDKDTLKMYPIDQAADRIKRVISEAKKHGVPDFVVNARSDALLRGGNLEEAIERGKAYLASGATNIFVWGGRARGGITKDEVIELAKAFDGKLNVSYKGADGGLTVKELSEIGVARISMGPALQAVAMKALGREAERVLNSGI